MIDETVEEIEEMHTHSSSIVAIKAARAMTELLDREYATVEEFKRSVEQNGDALKRANPSHASLQNALRTITGSVRRADVGSVDAGKEVLEEVIDEVIEDVGRGKHRAAENAADYLEDGMTFMTHDYSSTVLDAVELAVADGMEFEVYVTEAGPRHLGRKAARKLAEYDAVDVTLIADPASGYFLSEVDEIFIGMTCIVHGTLYNRIGTFPMVATAAQQEVPVTVVGSGAKIIEGGFAFENEYRSPSEVMREPADGFAIENPAYDATPVDLLDAVITDSGVHEY